MRGGLRGWVGLGRVGRVGLGRGDGGLGWGAGGGDTWGEEMDR